MHETDGDTYLQPREGDKCLAESRTSMTHKKITVLCHVMNGPGTLVARRLGAEEGVGRAKSERTRITDSLVPLK